MGELASFDELLCSLSDADRAAFVDHILRSGRVREKVRNFGVLDDARVTIRCEGAYLVLQFVHALRSDVTIRVAAHRLRWWLDHVADG